MCCALFAQKTKKKGAEPCPSLERSTCWFGVCANADKGAGLWLCCIADPTASMHHWAHDLELCPTADKGARLILSRLMILVWNGGLRLDGVPGGKVPATLGGLELATGLCLCGFVNHGPATRLARIAKALPQQTATGFPRWMPPLLPAFRFWRVGLGWCRAATTTEHTEQTHIRGPICPANRR